MMKNNYPPGAANDPDAPYNEARIKFIEVNISQCLSSVQTVGIPEYADETDSRVLEQAVREQVMLPYDYIIDIEKDYNWNLDDFCVSL